MVKISAKNLKKEIGIKLLYEGVTFDIDQGEKIALIGRNGYGKTTLFKILAGEDNEFEGEFVIAKGSRVIMTSQEHSIEGAITPLTYILQYLPKYYQLKSIIEDYEKCDKKTSTMEEYCDYVQTFSDLGYYEIEEDILKTLNDFQINIELALNPFRNLSGGQKRFVELAKIMHSGADIHLIDEPTNHMDYMGKERFINWLKVTKATQIIISHDRDILHYVDRIFELKNHQIYSFNGNYDKYILQNTHQNLSQIDLYKNDLKRIDKAKRQFEAAKIHKIKAKSTKSKMAAKIQEERFRKELDKLQDNLNKPSFWIDKKSIENIDKEIINSYNKFKEKNINISTKNIENHKRLLVRVRRLSLGYTTPLFQNLNFELYEGQRVFIKGKNGRGKTTLIKTLIAKADEAPGDAQIFNGEITCSPKLRIGIYEQEVHGEFLNISLKDALREVFFEYDIPADENKINQILGAYLFNPAEDGKLLVKNLSGGQKARFQLIKMLINNPNILILDEPTNHLDLPSIEELENALQNYDGGIIYISHDTYFEKEIGGVLIDLDKLTA